MKVSPTNDVSTTSGNVLSDGTQENDPDLDAVTAGTASLGADGNPRNDSITVSGVIHGTVANTFIVSSSGANSAVAGSYGSVNIASNGAYTYTLDNSLGAVQALATDEELTDTFTFTVSDANGGFTSNTLTITIIGTNDDPIISGGPDQTTLTEAAAALSTSGNLTVEDVDRTNIVETTKNLVVSGSSATKLDSNNKTIPADPSGSTYQQLLDMLTLTSNPILDNSEQSDTLHWSFNSSISGHTQTFDYLDQSENLILTYTITATDNEGQTADEQVIITINGSNQAPPDQQRSRYRVHS